MAIWLDRRLPPLVEIDEPTRQQKRRVTRRFTPCVKCFQPLTADDCCFTDGKDAHRSCGERWNAELFDGWGTLTAQDATEAEQETMIEDSAKSMGLALPSMMRETGLWTPASASRLISTPAAVTAVA